MIVKSSQKVAEKFVCEPCDYSTSRHYNFEKHLSTDKHKMIGMIVESSTPTTPHYKCSCGKKYKYDSGYYRHVKTCVNVENVQNAENVQNPKNVQNSKNVQNPKNVQNAENVQKSESLTNEFISMDHQNITIDKNFFIQIMKDNRELHELIIEQNKTKSITNNNNNNINTTNNNTTNNNNNTNNYNTFNLQIFLNEQCKDAINMIDFIKTLQFSPESVEYTGKHGYVEGITKLMIDGLKEMDIYKRPIHCTDIKRETLYIKEENKWEKDTEEKTKFRNALRDIVHKNMQQIRRWRQQNPRSEIMETSEYEFHFIIMQQCVGGGTGKQPANDNKIIKTIANYVMIDKTREANETK